MKFIELTQGQRAIVDDKTYDALSSFKWYAAKRGYTFYAQRVFGGRILHMHRLIMNPEKENEVDHINGNGLDNRRENLRVVARSQNQWNRGRQKNNKSGYKGVGCFPKGSWTARIKAHGKTMYLGRFLDKKDAARAYNNAAIKYHGKFAKLNII